MVIDEKEQILLQNVDVKEQMWCTNVKYLRLSTQLHCISVITTIKLRRNMATKCEIFMPQLNQASDALSHPSTVPEEIDREIYETISYATVCDDLQDVLDLTKVPIKCKEQIQHGSKEESNKMN